MTEAECAKLLSFSQAYRFLIENSACPGLPYLDSPFRLHVIPGCLLDHATLASLLGLNDVLGGVLQTDGYSNLYFLDGSGTVLPATRDDFNAAKQFDITLHI